MICSEQKKGEVTGGSVPETKSKSQWYAVQTKPRQEEIARQNLERQGFQVYLPRIAETKRRQGKLVQTISAYFPRYLFIRFDVRADNWSVIRSTRGVSGLVKVAGIPRPVPGALVDTLIKNEDSARLQRLEMAGWKPGDELEIEQGPFAGYRCVFHSYRGLERVKVLLNLISNPIFVSIGLQDLPVSQSA